MEYSNFDNIGDEYMNDEYTKKLDSDDDDIPDDVDNCRLINDEDIMLSKKEYTPCGKCKNKKRWTRLLPDKTFLCFKCVRCHKCNSDPCYFKDGTWVADDWAYCRKCADTVY